MQEKVVLGLAGTVASGKDTAARHIAQRHGFFHVSTSDIVRSEALKRQGSVSRDVLHNVANDIRRSEGIGALCLRAASLFVDKSEQPDTQNLIVSGIRALGEGHQIKAMGGKILFVDADPQVRYERLLSRSRAGEVTKTFDEFLAFELTEESSDDEYAQNLTAIRGIADYIVNNNSSEASFIGELDRFLSAE